MEDNIRINRLVIIGNGFDLAHGLKTSYKDFIKYYINSSIKSFFEGGKHNYKDDLLSIIAKNSFLYPDRYYLRMVNYWTDKEVDEVLKVDPIELLNRLRSEDGVSVKKSEFFERILKNLETKGWTDIESDYYALLKKYADNIEVCETLNNQMDFLRDKLAEYLNTQETPQMISELPDIFNSTIDISDIAPSRRMDFIKYRGYNPQKTVVLDFNYTPTTGMYENSSIIVLHIHGSLDNTKSMIFGYGDEMDKDFQELEDRNENELLKNTKSVKYLEDDKYYKLMNFIGGLPYQVFIMGHSCGNSDRTLLHTIFEHENCISIKPFYHKKSKNDGDDDYSNIIQNIYRNFKDKTLFRDRVVNKMKCVPMPQVEKKTVIM